MWENESGNEASAFGLGGAMGMRGYAGSQAQKEDRKEAEQKKFKRTLTCGHTIMVTFRKNVYYCESCRTRRRPIAGAELLR